MIALSDLRPLPLLGEQLERWLEKIHEQPHGRVEPRQNCRSFQTLQATVAYDPANYCAVLLLDEGLVIFAIGRQRVNTISAA